MLHLFFIWFMFEFGQGISIALKLNAVVVDKTNAASSRTAILLARWPVFLARIFFASCVFGLFAAGGLSAVIRATGHDAPLGLDEFAAMMNTGVAPWLAGILGLASDFVLSKIPGLASYVPQEG